MTIRAAEFSTLGKTAVFLFSALNSVDIIYIDLLLSICHKITHKTQPLQMAAQIYQKRNKGNHPPEEVTDWLLISLFSVCEVAGVAQTGNDVLMSVYGIIHRSHPKRSIFRELVAYIVDCLTRRYHRNKMHLRRVPLSQQRFVG